MSTQSFSPTGHDSNFLTVLQADTEKKRTLAQSILDPVLFAPAWLKTDLWYMQKEILQSIQVNIKTAVKACHASSKTFTAAIATVWWLAAYQESIVITTAPTMNQVQNLLWAEINTLVGKSLYPYPKPNLTSLKIAPNRYALGFTTNVEKGDEGTKFQGFHSKKILVILDEAPGVVGKLWTAMEGLLASGDVRVLALGNPTISSGSFFDAFGANRADWKTFTISAFDTPNFDGLCIEYLDSKGIERKIGKGTRDLRTLSEDELNTNVLPYLVSRRWVKDRLLEWGVENPAFRSRCLGEFAAQAPDALLSLSWLEQQKLNKPKKRKHNKVQIGIDVAGPGEDETVMCARCDEQVVLLKAWPEQDPRGEIISELHNLRNNGWEIENVNVDTCGIGYYLARHIEDFGYVVSDVNVGLPSDDSEYYLMLKAQFYWGLRLRLQDGDMCGLEDEKTIAQLAGIRYKTNSRGQIVIEPKEEAVKRGVKSPDRAESVMLAFARPGEHGLISFWGQQAEVVKEEAEKAPIPDADPTDLSDSQKELAGWSDMIKEHNLVKAKTNELAGKEGIKTLGKVMTSSQQPNNCPNCGNKFLNIFAEGSWRCGACGKNGRGSQMYNENGELV